jgi:hypothetical protein
MRADSLVDVRLCNDVLSQPGFGVSAESSISTIADVTTPG